MPRAASPLIKLSNGEAWYQYTAKNLILWQTIGTGKRDMRIYENGKSHGKINVYIKHNQYDLQCVISTSVLLEQFQ